jgi:hypothetical protein
MRQTTYPAQALPPTLVVDERVIRGVDTWSLVQKHTATQLRLRSLLAGGVQEIKLERLARE